MATVSMVQNFDDEEADEVAYFYFQNASRLVILNPKLNVGHYRTNLFGLMDHQHALMNVYCCARPAHVSFSSDTLDHRYRAGGVDDRNIDVALPALEILLWD